MYNDAREHVHAIKQLSDAVCDIGDIAIGGSYRITSVDINFDYLVTFNGNVGTDTYRTIIQDLEETGQGTIGYQSRVLCFDNPPLRP